MTGRDLIRDFVDGTDKIALDRGLWGDDPPDAAGLLASATVTTTGLLLDFGDGNSLDIRGIFNATLLVDDILFL